MLARLTVATTLDAYSHVMPAMHSEDARALDELVR